MEIDRPPPGEDLSFAGEPSIPRPAATIILLRGGDEDLEVLLVRRTPQARFMGGVWVFPGGAVDADEGEGDAGHRAAAVRELYEEAGIGLDDPGALVRFSRWITPPEISSASTRTSSWPTRPTASRRWSTATRSSTTAG